LRAAELGAIQGPIHQQASPLRQYEQQVRQHGVDPAPQPAPLDTTMFSSSPLQDLRAQIRNELIYDPKPLVPQAEPVSTVHTPPWSHGSHRMLTEPGLSLSVDLGPLLWIHADRGAPGQVGLLLNEVA